MSAALLVRGDELCGASVVFCRALRVGLSRCCHSAPSVDLGAEDQIPIFEKAVLSAVVSALPVLYRCISSCDSCKLTSRKNSHRCPVPRFHKHFKLESPAEEPLPSLLPKSSHQSQASLSSRHAWRSRAGKEGRTRVCRFSKHPRCKALGTAHRPHPKLSQPSR